MSPNSDRPKPKDGWDKADIVIKLITGAVIVGIGFLINSAASRVTQATQKGQLAASLVDSLVKQDPGVKRDIVLTTLNSIVGEDQPALICALSLQIVRADFRTAPALAPSAPQAGQYDASEEATRILKQRCPDQLTTLVNVADQKPQLSAPNAEKRRRRPRPMIRRLRRFRPMCCRISAARSLTSSTEPTGKAQPNCLPYTPNLRRRGLYLPAEMRKSIRP